MDGIVPVEREACSQIHSPSRMHWWAQTNSWEISAKRSSVTVGMNYSVCVENICCVSMCVSYFKDRKHGETGLMLCV